MLRVTSWEKQVQQNYIFINCHTRLHLGFLAKLGIWQVLACRMEPQSGLIIWKNFLPPAPEPVQTEQLSIFCKYCAVSPTQQSMCGFPTPTKYVWCPPSQYVFSFNVVHCLHPICSTHQEGKCGVPPSGTNFSVWCPPLSNVIMCLCHTWLCLGF